nr:MAG TPA: hypothetical protein [Caudoviricetes sp.]
MGLIQFGKRMLIWLYPSHNIYFIKRPVEI